MKYLIFAVSKICINGYLWLQIKVLQNPKMLLCHNKIIRRHNWYI